MKKRDIKFKFWDYRLCQMFEMADWNTLDGLEMVRKNLRIAKLTETMYEKLQFTELQDSFENDIYHGEIIEVVKGDQKTHYEIEMTRGSWVARRGDRCEALFDLVSDWEYSVKVVGNIFEDGYLLKEIKKLKKKEA